MTATPTEATLEALITAQDAHFRSEGTCDEARMESRLWDAAIACGMAWDHDDLRGWVATTLRVWLTSGPCGPDDFEDDVEEGIGTDEYGRFEYAS